MQLLKQLLGGKSLPNISISENCNLYYQLIAGDTNKPTLIFLH